MMATLTPGTDNPRCRSFDTTVRWSGETSGTSAEKHYDKPPRTVVAWRQDGETLALVIEALETRPFTPVDNAVVYRADDSEKFGLSPPAASALRWTVFSGSPWSRWVSGPSVCRRLINRHRLRRSCAAAGATIGSVPFRRRFIPLFHPGM
ncbi:hypothetical protein [Streptomyces vinaceus]|uniref:hypothetical protein n=1 Tax=Streptomyces vinaceus TaxID=1960 RepID=UPI001671DAC7|nr:hypothetical protein [Streptomyces vinaceus]GHE46192.1 hypothetical protein GCM10017778_32570 [Streptomyces vinaceus]